jgi:hypothetical protein
MIFPIIPSHVLVIRYRMKFREIFTEISQFYNNWCGVKNYGNQWAWNWPTWEALAEKYPGMQIFLGVPADTYAGGGYIAPSGLAPIIADISRSKAYGGVMVSVVLQRDDFVDGMYMMRDDVIS